MGLIYVDYDQYVSMQYQLKNLSREIDSLQSGLGFDKLEEGNRRIRRYYEKEIRTLNKEISSLKKSMDKMMEMWFQVFEDIQEEQKKKEKTYQQEIDKEQEKTQKALEKAEKLQGELTKKNREVVEERKARIDAEEKYDGLYAKTKQTHETSSIPSSKESFRNKVTNNREKSDLKQGAQPGHRGHGRKSYSPTQPQVVLPVPPEILNNPDYYEEKKPRVHQVVEIQVNLVVTEYVARVFRNRKTGERYQPPFPDFAQLDVNFGAGIRSMIFIMKNHMNCSEENIIEYLKWITDQELSVSRGFVNSITSEFVDKTQKEYKEIYEQLVTSDVLYADMTGVRQNGEQKNVVACTNKEQILYCYREHKGKEGYKGTPVQFCESILVHDHDKTFYNFGCGLHQSCNAHHLRYLKGAMETETQLTWHAKMRALLTQMNDTRNKQSRILTPEQISDFKRRYLEILDLADREYEDNPPSEYYRKGYNLSRELREYMDATLLFLDHPEVDFTNNICESAIRKVKRHLVISGTFRGFTTKSAQDYCSAMTVLQTWRLGEGNIYEMVKEAFRRKRPAKQVQTKEKKEA